MTPGLGIVIPAFNERGRLADTLADIISALESTPGSRMIPEAPGAGDLPVPFEVVVVDDGSTDGTAIVVEELDDPRVSCLRLPSNHGKGAAVRAGLQATTARWILVCDADSSARITELARLVDTARSTGTEVVVASRADADSEIGHRQPRRREILGQTYNRLLRLLGLTSLRDTQCGFKLFKGDLARSLAEQLTIDGFAYDVELLWLAQRAGAPPASVGIRWDHDARTHVQTFRHGGRMVLDALRIRWPGLTRRRQGIAISLLLATTLMLHLWASHSHSLTGDGAYHLVAGHQALRYGTNTVNLEHPPLAKLAMSLPTLLWEPLAPPIEVGDAVETAIGLAGRPEAMWRATLAGRYVVLLLFVVPSLFACIALGAAWGGRLAGWLLAAMVLFSFPVVGTLTILQTDAAVMLGFLLTVLAALRFVASPSTGRAVALGAAYGFAMAVKFSGALLGPTAAVALAIGLWRRSTGGQDPVPEGAAEDPRTAVRRWWYLVTLPLIVFAVSAAVLHAAFVLANLGYDPALGRSTIQAYVEGEGLITGSSLQPLEPLLLGLEPYDHGLAQWLTGFFAVRAQNQIGVYPSYAFGVVTSAGRWWYHPVVFLLTTPLVILMAAGTILVGWLRRQRRLHETDDIRKTTPRDEAQSPGLGGAVLVAVTLLVYGTTAVLSNYNLGYRHLLPVVPLLYLPVAVVLSRRAAAGILLVAVLIVESLAVGPVWASASNTWWLGARNPTRHALGGMEFGQSLALLGKSTRSLEPSGLGVLDPALRPEVLQAYVPNGRLVQPGDALDPGWYAVGITAEQFLPALLGDLDRPDNQRPVLLFGDALRAEAQRWFPIWQELVRRGEDHGYVAETYHLYRVPEDDGTGSRRP